jgi:hypothetical protein
VILNFSRKQKTENTEAETNVKLSRKQRRFLFSHLDAFHFSLQGFRRMITNPIQKFDEKIQGEVTKKAGCDADFIKKKL